MRSQELCAPPLFAGVHIHSANPLGNYGLPRHRRSQHQLFIDRDAPWTVHAITSSRAARVHHDELASVGDLVECRVREADPSADRTLLQRASTLELGPTRDVVLKAIVQRLDLSRKRATETYTVNAAA
jgi:hypothetical protein